MNLNALIYALKRIVHGPMADFSELSLIGPSSLFLPFLLSKIHLFRLRKGT